MEEYLAKSYDEGADFFDERFWTLFWERNEKPLVFNLFEFDKYKRILDVGCGTGNYIIDLLNRNITIIGIDISSKMLEACKRKINNYKGRLSADVRLFRVSFLENEFENESFDLILMTRVLCHFENLNKALIETHRLLNNRGDLVISDFHPEYNIQNAILKNPNSGKKIVIPICIVSPEMLRQKLSDLNIQLKNLITISMSNCLWIPDKGTSFNDELRRPERKIFYIMKFTKGDTNGQQ